ncbi:hypothetical protein Q0590_35810 [Rhodocytophaga aerolata]|uniref:Uncharacterized protein n=1 Tax=Rhodocytophaga aerolata TaxID=455078 RepID=A0ABT8RHZ0_9BACT|nr:hypothetical protein [Rhodocytophaga aerolata]MDO1451695.1 hypothetical protein [Rhodocytophaga aerolata]
MITSYKPLELGQLLASQASFSTWMKSKWTMIAIAIFFLLLIAIHLYSKNAHTNGALLKSQTKDPKN